jgi:hypothetical protein
MGSPIVGSSDPPIIGENRCLRKWVKKTEGPKIVQYETQQGHKITLNRAPPTELIQKKSLPLTTHE